MPNLVVTLDHFIEDIPITQNKYKNIYRNTGTVTSVLIPS